MILKIDGLSLNVFYKNGKDFLNINVNHFLPEIEEIRFISNTSKSTVIGIGVLENAPVKKSPQANYSLEKCRPLKKLHCGKLPPEKCPQKNPPTPSPRQKIFYANVFYVFYTYNSCFKRRFKRGALTGKVCQKMRMFYALTVSL